MSRAYIPLKVKLASALLQLGDVPHEIAEELTPEQIIGLYQWHHYPVPHAHGGPDTASNLMPMLKAAHQERTAKVDIPQLAKTKRISREHDEFVRRILTPRDQRPKKKSKLPSRPFPKRRKPKP